SSNLSEEDIDKAIKEAEAHAEEDKKRKEFVETKNNADNMIYSLEKLLKENGDKLSVEDKKRLEDEIEKAKKEFESDDIEVIKKELDELTKVSNEIFTKMYQNANPNGANGTGDAGNAGNNDSNNDGDPEVTIE
ncbi:MAG: Hsp70 family protein, partial [Candidatus Caccovivens sp.]